MREHRHRDRATGHSARHVVRRGDRVPLVQGPYRQGRLPVVGLQQFRRPRRRGPGQRRTVRGPRRRHVLAQQVHGDGLAAVPPQESDQFGAGGPLVEGGPDRLDGLLDQPDLCRHPLTRPLHQPTSAALCPYAGTPVDAPRQPYHQLSGRVGRWRAAAGHTGTVYRVPATRHRSTPSGNEWRPCATVQRPFSLRRPRSSGDRACGGSSRKWLGVVLQVKRARGWGYDRGPSRHGSP